MCTKPEPPSSADFDSMRSVVDRLRALKAEALIDLYELDQAFEELRQSAETPRNAALHAHANIEQLAAMGLLGEVTAGALSRNSQAVISSAEALQASLRAVRVGLDGWGIAETHSPS
jgi:DNA-binding protein H-NS